MLAVITAASVFAGAPLTALAETVVYDETLRTWRCFEDDGSIGTDKWAQNDRGRWLCFGPDGISCTKECDKPYPIVTGPDGAVLVDRRVRSVTGQPGQQPLLSVPGTEEGDRYDGLRQTLDAIPLYPDATTGIPELDAMLDHIFAHIITPDMDTYDKLKACYDYLIINMRDPMYEEVGEGEEMVLTFFLYDAGGALIPRTYVNAWDLLRGKIGVCDTYSACFAVMAWKLGLPMYIAGGDNVRGGGLYTPDAWCQLDGPDGTTYIFDPYTDYLLTLQDVSTLSDLYFGPAREQAAGKYMHASAIFDVQG